ncbi:MAG: DUF1553 domain-containing protein [Pirellulaceae bacterium]|nr:DUF1553 domain-containing protein [Pirellulaceae bacterium]
MNRLLGVTIALLCLSCCWLSAAEVDFLRDVKPILAQRCFRCHSSLEEEAGLRLDSVAAILKGGENGPAVLAGKSGESKLILAVLRQGDLQMPPEGAPLTAAQIDVLRAWIDAGAKPPAEGAETKVSHWSFTKPIRPAVSQPADPAWSQNPIDAFIAAKHAELKLTPVGEAPPNLLLRRLYIDLIGLPPTEAELADFEKSFAPSPSLPLSPSFQERESGGVGEREKGLEKVVDALLASPHHGERWGRHWMDVWRYSDWDGYGNEIRESKPHIWRWRDWIIESLNGDKPYDRMVQEMLAADELAPGDPDALRATGFLVRNWYKFNRNKWLDDTIEHTGKAFLGVTFNCCRCHDHMYDPLAQHEYYELRAVFEPYDIRTDRVPGEPSTDKDGLVRVYDAKADAQTFLFIRGNEKEPLKEEPLAPAVPKLFTSVPFAVVPVSLPQVSAYPGLQAFMQEEALAAAKREVEKAKTSLGEAEKKWTEVVAAQATSTSPLSPRGRGIGGEGAAAPTIAESGIPQPPAPPSELIDADSQLALSRATLAAAQANLTFAEARIAADKANYAAPPAANARELALAAGTAERQANLQTALKGLVQAEINLTAAERAKKQDDMKTVKAVTDAQTALVAALKARETAVLNLDKPGDYTRLSPIFPATSTGRRLALARWIASPDNPLAARVAINHMWLRHFGTPLVPTVFDFGINGKPPTNQALLDWLACELMENGWRMKPIHKLIVTSKTYRLASSGGVQGSKFKVQGSEASTLNFELGTLNLKTDPENLYYWRANPRRMEAEIVRDATLFVAGSLDVARGGPDLDQASGLTSNRRSVYFRASKEKKMQFLAMFDSPNPVECYRRSESIAPQQALAMANSTLTLAQARLLAKKLSDSLVNVTSEQASSQFVESAFVRILCRKPTADELATCASFLTEQTAKLADPKSLTLFASGPAASVPPSTDPQQRARENLVHVLLNHNDFVTVR